MSNKIQSVKNMEGVTLHFSNRSGGFVIFDCIFRNDIGERKIYTAKVRRFKHETPEDTMERHYASMQEWENKTATLSENLFFAETPRASVRFVVVALVEKRQFNYNVKKANFIANTYERQRIAFNRIIYGTENVINVHNGGNGRPVTWL
jgi:hypothetical protein